MEFIPWDNPDNIISAEAEKIVYQIQDNLLALLVLIGVPANVINMAVFYRQGLGDRVNLCLFTLSLADGLFLISALMIHGEQIPSQFSTADKFGPFTAFLINHNFVVFMGFSFVSSILSAIIATERCLCVYNPLKFQSLIRTRTMAGIILSVFIIVFSLFYVMVYRYRVGCVHDMETGVVLTTFVKGQFYQAHEDFIKTLDSVTFGAGLPGTVLVVVMTTTILTVVKLRQIVTWRSGTSSSISPSEVALTKMLVGNSMLFIVCFTPDALNHFMKIFIPEMNSGRRYHNFFLAALWVGDIFNLFNATFNFFVYYTMGSRYRETFWTLFGRKSKPLKA
ncbi:uncharacterized protein LOC143277119 [Babylonia areolata]|uniref:uncharacterized protein LOC143277119 n=1 Tax=Babylonia areolata TaxID=304850 RepID=UPI003FCEEB6B